MAKNKLYKEIQFDLTDFHKTLNPECYHSDLVKILTTSGFKKSHLDRYLLRGVALGKIQRKNIDKFGVDYLPEFWEYSDDIPEEKFIDANRPLFIGLNDDSVSPIDCAISAIKKVRGDGIDYDGITKYFDIDLSLNPLYPALLVYKKSLMKRLGGEYERRPIDGIYKDALLRVLILKNIED